MEALADSAAQVSLGGWISVSEGAAVEGDSTPEFHLSPRLFARRDLATGVSCKIRHGAWMMRVRGVGAVGGLILSTADARLPATPPAVSTAGRGASLEAPAFLGGLQCAPSSTWTGSISLSRPEGDAVQVAGSGRPVGERPPAAPRYPRGQVLHGKSFGDVRGPVEAQAPGRLSPRPAALPAGSRGVLRAFSETQGPCPAGAAGGDQRTVEVIRTKEKGSDVNLAVHLLNDGWLDTYDCGIVVGNDSDIAEAMRLVRRHRG